MILKLAIIGLILVTESLQNGFPENEENSKVTDFERTPAPQYNGKDRYVKHSKKDYNDKKRDEYVKNRDDYDKKRDDYDKKREEFVRETERNYNKRPEKYEKYEKYEKNKSYKKQKYYKDVDEKHYGGNDRFSEKEQKHWEGKKYHKSHDRDYTPNSEFTNVNEIDSNDHQKGKHNSEKYSSHPNHFDSYGKDTDISHHDKHAEHGNRYDHDKRTKEEYPGHVARRPVDLSRDTNVNYVDNHKHIAADSEFIDVANTQASNRNKEQYQQNIQNGEETYLKRVKKDFYKELKVVDLSNPPPANNTVLMARYIAHNIDWAALATLSSRSPLKGSPFVNVISFSDGPTNKGSGVPFFYMTPQDLSSQDLSKDNRCSVTVTLAQTNYCQQHNLDPEDPRCARLILSGKVKPVKAGSTEEEFAKNALFSRHPVMESWPADHDWYFAKLKIGQVVLLDRFGGSTQIDVRDYLNVENPSGK